MIKLLFYRDYNFGDNLSRFIVEKVSDMEVLPKNMYNPSILWQVKTMLKCLLHWNWSFFREVLFFYEKPVMAIGSILCQGNYHTKVWGSGFMNRDEKFRGGIIYALRGKHSYNMLKAQGVDTDCRVFGDPAFLLPLFIAPSCNKKYEVSIIPHFSEYDFFSKTYSGKYHVIDLSGNHIQRVVDEITASKVILSTSLHGIIVAHAYGIPALWIKKGNIETDGVKFYDYFSSVDIKEYDGFVFSEVLHDNGIIFNTFEKYQSSSLPRKDVSMIQKELLEVAPFPVRKELLAKK